MQPYVFISYAHVNSPSVLPVIQHMQNSGIELWYDSGIEAGSEWPEYIANKLIDCEKFVLFISKAYLNSQNCKRELNFAISRKKEILSVFLEEVQLSPGVEMQLGTYQAIFRSRFNSEMEFRTSLAAEAFFRNCRTGAAPVPPKQSAPRQEQPMSPSEKARQAYARQQSAGSQPTWNAPPQPNPSPTYTTTGNAQQFAGGSYDARSQYATGKNRFVAAALAFFLGAFGAQRFYMGQSRMGLLCLLFCWTYIPILLGFYDAFMLVTKSDEALQAKYGCRFG